MFSLRDPVVENFEAALQKQGSLSNGKMTAPAPSPKKTVRPRVPIPVQRPGEAQKGQSASHEPFTPTTPAFYPSPTSPSTSAIPATPSLTQDSSWRTPSPYAAYANDRTAFYSSPYSRRRSVTTSSVHSPYRLTPVALPIGKKLPKWREVHQERALNRARARSSYAREHAGTPSRSSDSSLSPYRRPERTPLGPRPMRSQSPSYASGLCITVPRSKDGDRSAALGSAVEALQALLDPDARRKREQVEQWLGSTALAETPDRPRSLAGTLPDGPVTDSAPEDTADESPAQSSSDGSQEALGAPFTPSSTWAHRAPGLAVQIGALAPPLDAPFDYDAAPIAVERSAFDSDTEDEDEDEDKVLDQIRISKFSRLRKALKSSISVPNIAGVRRSFVDMTGQSSLDTSPESVSSLRARQTTSTTSPPKNPILLKLATDAAALSPVPPSPAGLADSESPADGDAPQSPTTPATPASPKARETRSFIFEMSKVSLGIEAPPPLPSIARCHGPPPDLPLPPTPPFASTPSLPLRAPAEREECMESFARRWKADAHPHDRMTVVDPDVSMARLQETMAKLEAYAPRASREEGDAPVPAEFPRGSAKTDASSRPMRKRSASSRPADKPGVLVLGIAPPPVPPKSAQPKPPRAHTRRPSVPLLPLFDFERPGSGGGLDLRVPPVRTTSLDTRSPGGDDEPELVSSQGHSAELTPRPRESPASPPPPQGSQTTREPPQVTPHRIVLPAALPVPPLHVMPLYFPQRRLATPPATPPAHPRGGVASHFSPESPSPPQRAAPRASKMRRLLGVRTDLMRGLRGSFVS
ncbi:hypothetical protein PsYK624_117040 [Phanerochaete sordida]|uniref:Uncharacterized protein n=1 Tax=Phanerochaete sordida TaxID=48140 RepID=A0A9P3GJQ3_9APHY|nr:hypothetical protein PsYK624_117040 [Phanerochaete sordida]